MAFFVYDSDDVMDSEKMYHAFLLYDDADVEFAAEIIKNLESPPYNLKVCTKNLKLMF